MKIVHPDEKTLSTYCVKIQRKKKKNSIRSEFPKLLYCQKMQLDPFGIKKVIGYNAL